MSFVVRARRALLDAIVSMAVQDQIFGGQAVDRIARRLHWPMTKKPLIQNFERPPRLTWASRVPPKVLP